MAEKSNDSAGLTALERLPWLPRSLREAWSQDVLPDWAVAELGLPDGATYSALGAPPAGVPRGTNDRLERLLVRRVQGALYDLGSRRIFDREWPAGLEFPDLPLKTRTRNALLKEGLFRTSERIAEATYDDLADVYGLGGVGVLDFARVVEAALDRCASRAEEAMRALDHMSLKSGEPNQAIASLVSEAGDALLACLDEPWCEMVSSRDPRFAELMPRGNGTILDHIDSLTSSLQDEHQPVRELELAQAIARVRVRITEIAALPLQDALREYLRAVTGWDDRRLQAVTMRLGFNEQGPSTLEAAAGVLGVSRERLRQLMTALGKKLPDHPVVMPQLDSALTMLAAAAPIEASEAGRLLVRRGLAGEEIHPLGLVEAARLCGRTSSIRVEIVRATPVVMFSADVQQMAAVARVARMQARASGVTTIGEVVEELAAVGAAVPGEGVARYLQALPEVEFLDANWLWFPREEGNRIASLVQKMLSVHQPQTVQSLRTGIRRENRFRKTRGRSGWPLIIPPTDVLQQLLIRHRAFNVSQESRVALQRAVDYRAGLTTAERVLVDALRASPSGILDRGELFRAAVQAGVNPNTVSVTTSYSCVIEHLGVGMWSTRGARHDPADVEAFRAANAMRGRPRRTIGYTWTDEGKLSVAFQLPEILTNVTLSIPAPVVRYLGGRDYQVEADGASSYGAVKVYEMGISAGYMPFLRACEAEAGDVLVADFDIAAGTVRLRLEIGEILDFDAYD